MLCGWDRWLWLRHSLGLRGLQSWSPAVFDNFSCRHPPGTLVGGVDLVPPNSEHPSQQQEAQGGANGPLLLRRYEAELL